MTSNSSKILADRIERAIEMEITRRMGTVSNPVLRASIQDLLREDVNARILRALSANPPKTIDIVAAVEQSMNDLASSVKSLKGNGQSLKGNFKSAGTSDDNGGKTTDSGSKTRSRPSPTSDYGGKGRDHGGK